MSREPTDGTSSVEGGGNRTYRFGEYELATQPLQLTRGTERQDLAPQPARLLELLVSRAGEMVSRDEIRLSLWGNDVHVDYERGINFNIRQIRAALEDDPSRPRFIETVPRHGYRFVALVDGAASGSRWKAPSGTAVAALLLLLLVVILGGGLTLWKNLAGRGSVAPQSAGEAADEELSRLPPPAAEAYRVGLRLMESHDSVDWEKALSAFEETIEAAPAFASAHTGLARVHLALLELEEAQAAAARALELDAAESQAHYILAEVLMHRSLSTEEPRRYLEDALALDPQDHDSTQLLSLLLVAEGRTDEAVEQSRQLYELDPFSWLGRWTLSWALFMDRRYAEAAEQIRASIQLYPRHSVTPYHLLLQSLIRLGRADEALDEANAYLEARGQGSASMASLEEWWRFWADRSPEPRDYPGSQDRSQKAILLVAAGETEAALARLRDACEKHSAWDLRFLPYDPRFDSLRLKPGFQEILACLEEPSPP